MSLMLYINLRNVALINPLTKIVVCEFPFGKAMEKHVKAVVM